MQAVKIVRTGGVLSLLSAGAQMAINMFLLSPLMIGLAALGFSATAAMLMTHSALVAADVWTVPTAMSILAYTYDRVIDVSTADANPGRAHKHSKHAWIHNLCLYGSLAFLVVKLLLLQWAAFKWVLLFSLLVVTYNVKWIPCSCFAGHQLGFHWIRVKAIPCLKNVIVRGSWCLAGLFAESLLRANGVEFVDLGARNGFVVINFLWIFVCAIASHNRDHFEDSKQGSRTVSTVFGIQATYWLAECILLIMMIACSLPCISHSRQLGEMLSVRFSLGVEAVGIVPGVVITLAGIIWSHVLFAPADYRPLCNEDARLCELVNASKLGGILFTPLMISVVLGL